MEDSIWNKLTSLANGKSKLKIVETEIIPVSVKTNNSPEANYAGTPLFSVSFNGEKNMGEIGPIKDYKPDYDLLRLRSWQAYIESEVAQIVMKRFTTWVIGRGLKLQSEPNKFLLSTEGIDLDSEAFSKIVEARFQVYRKSKKSDYSNMRNLDLIAKRAYLNSIVGGDCLVVLRYDGNNVNVQLIDGCHIQSPIYGDEQLPAKLADGNVLINGIELNEKGEHVRYYIRNRDFKFSIVEAKGKSTGMLMAFMVYGLEYRLDNVRGLPLITVVLETLKKLERYKEATVGSAEERQKIVYQIVHQAISDGSNPLISNLAKAFNPDGQTDQLPIDVDGKQLANTVAATTNKSAFNMPIGAELKGLESKNELYFKDFYSVNVDLICATLGIPPEVAMSKYDSNFSASRAALKDWEHTLNVLRSEFSFAFYQPIYNFWMYIEILKNKIPAPGFIEAKNTNNDVVLESYRNARFVGANVPHIDPLKEVAAERAKLGAAGADIPLTTVEAATEALNGGDSTSNIDQFSKELETAKNKGIISEPPPKVSTP